MTLQHLNHLGLRITWLGHSTFLLELPSGKRVLIDPWVDSNPACPEAFHGLQADVVLCTHGHGDHIGDLKAVMQRGEPTLVAIYELVSWAVGGGVPGDRVIGMNKGGRVRLDGLDVIMTDARHSSAWIDEEGVTYLGEAAGFVLQLASGVSIYVAGDTSLFRDMQTIAELYRPDVAILPIGDLYTMDPEQAAIAAQWLGVRAVIPCHYGTFPALTGTPQALEAALAKRGLAVDVLAMEPGQTLGEPG